jgi:adenylylsulfate kinase-like enzyme
MRRKKKNLSLIHKKKKKLTGLSLFFDSPPKNKIKIKKQKQNIRQKYMENNQNF